MFFSKVMEGLDVASQLADETLFLSYPKEELESKFLVDPSPCERAAFCLRKRTTNLLFKTTDVCALLFGVQCFTCIILFKMSPFCAMHFPSDSILFKC